MINFLVNLIWPYVLLLWDWIYLLVFMVVIIETLVWIGFIFPGSTIIVVISFLSFHTWILPFLLFLSALFWTIVWYSINYFLWYYVSKNNIKIKVFFINEKLFSKAKHIINKHPIKALIFWRLTLWLKETIPFLSWYNQINFWIFLVYSIIWTFLWGLVHIGLPYIFSYSLYKAELWITRLSDAIILLVIIWAIFSFIKHHYSKKK